MRHFWSGIDLQSEIRKSAFPGMICPGQTQMEQTAVHRRMTANRAGLRIELQPLRQRNAIFHRQLISKRLAIRVADGIERNLSANITIRFDCQIGQRLYHLWRVINKIMWRIPTVIIGKTDGVNKMPGFDL